MRIFSSLRPAVLGALLIAGLSACGGGDGSSAVNDSPAAAQAKHLVVPVVAGALCTGAQGYTLLDGQCVASSPLMAGHQAAKLADKKTVTADAFFGWAQTTFSPFFPGVGATATLTANGYVYRAYTTGNIVAVTTAPLSGLAAGAVFVLGPLTSNTLVNVGTLDGFSCSVDATTCASTNPPTGGSGSINSYADCFGPSLYTPGTTYQIDESNSTNGAVTQTTTAKYTVNQPTSFKGNTANELQVNTTVLTTTSTSQPAGSTSTLKLYGGLSGSSYGTYGSILSFSVTGFGNISVTTYYVPPLQTPVSLTAGQSYQVNSVIKSESSSPLVPAAADINAAFTITFVGSEQVTTPAGTFLACKTTTQQVSSTGTLLTTTWLVGEGAYKGMFLKSDDGKGGIAVATKLLLNGS